MFKFASICLCFVTLFTHTTCRESRAQSFGDAFSAELEQPAACVCEPFGTEELGSMHRFLKDTAESLRVRWHQSDKPDYVDWIFPKIVAFYDNGRWSVKCDPSLATLPAHRLAMQFVSTELRNRRPPCQKTFAIVYTFDLLDDIVEKNVEGNIVKNNGQAENWKPIENRFFSLSASAQQDVDFGPYMADTQRKIRMRWQPPVSSTSARVTCVFKVHTDGSMSDLRIVESCGSAELEKASLNAISAAAPFLKLPDRAPPDVDIQFTFNYNHITHKCENGDPVYRVGLTTPELFSVRRHNFLRQSLRNLTAFLRPIDWPHHPLPAAPTGTNSINDER